MIVKDSDDREQNFDDSKNENENGLTEVEALEGEEKTELRWTKDQTLLLIRLMEQNYARFENEF